MAPSTASAWPRRRHMASAKSHDVKRYSRSIADHRPMPWRDSHVMKSAALASPSVNRPFRADMPAIGAMRQPTRRAHIWLAEGGGQRRPYFGATTPLFVKKARRDIGGNNTRRLCRRAAQHYYDAAGALLPNIAACPVIKANSTISARPSARKHGGFATRVSWHGYRHHCGGLRPLYISRLRK